MELNLKLNKPIPLAVEEQLHHFTADSDISATIKLLEDKKYVLVSEVYSNGLTLMHEIQKHVKNKFSDDSFQGQKEYRAAYQRLSNLALIEIKSHQLAVKKSPSIGWFEKLYPEESNFLLPFPKVQGLNSAWQWYKKGINIPVLRNKLHPYYGTYFPTRFDHLILFDNWLKRYKGPKKSAMEVGIGSGVLSFQLVQHGFQKVFATDTNPNAILGLKEFMGETKLSRKIELDFAPFFGQWEKQTELIVFNPPWLPESKDSDGNETAMNYDDKLFPTFFAAAKERLLPEGKLLLIFSNLAQVTNVTKGHPIEQELATGGRFKLERCFKKKVKKASDKTKRNQNWRAEEEIELWVITH